MNENIPYPMRIELCAEILGVDPAKLRQALDGGPPDRILDYEQAAELLGTTVQRLRARVHRGTIPYIRSGARTVRFSEKAILKAAG